MCLLYIGPAVRVAGPTSFACVHQAAVQQCRAARAEALGGRALARHALASASAPAAKCEQAAWPVGSEAVWKDDTDDNATVALRPAAGTRAPFGRRCLTELFCCGFRFEPSPPFPAVSRRRRHCRRRVLDDPSTSALARVTTFFCLFVCFFGVAFFWGGGEHKPAHRWGPSARMKSMRVAQ